MEHIAQIVDTFEAMEAKYIFSEEASLEGTPHLQGYVELKKRDRPSAFGLPFRWSLIHWEVAKANKYKNHAYCTKGDGPQYTNMPPPAPETVQITYGDLLRGQKALVDDFRDAENALFGRKIHVFVDEVGGWGKTITTKYMIDQMDAIVVAGKTADAAFAIARRIEYELPIPIVVFDIPRGGRRVINWHAVEKIKDGCLFATKYESGMLRFNSPHVIVFTNEWPDLSRLSADRWVVHDLSQPGKYSHDEQPDEPSLEELWCREVEQKYGEEKKE